MGCIRKAYIKVYKIVYIRKRKVIRVIHRKEKIQFVDEHLPEIPFITEVCREEIVKTCDNEVENISKDCFLGDIFSPNSNCSVLSSKATLQFQESRGRFLVAAEEIRMGEIVAVENPIVTFPINHEWKVV